MQKDDLKCVLIGRNVKIYNDLARLVRKIDSTSRFKQVEPTKSDIVTTLKKVSGPSLVFISDEITFSLELLSDLVWHFSADSIVVIISSKARSVAFKKPFDNTQFARLKLSENSRQSEPTLQFLIQSARVKAEFRRCKSLLGVSEKRCQWLVESSREAVAFVSREMHWYANAAYLSLFEISSIQELRTITIKDLITNNEHQLFDEFLLNQKKSSDSNHSILLSMKKSNGAKFRASIYLIPSVFKGHKCYQLWIKKVNSIDTDDVILKDKKDDSFPVLGESINLQKTQLRSETVYREMNPFSEILNKKLDTSIFPDIKPSFNESNIKRKNTTIKTKIKNTYSSNSLLKGVIKRNEAKIVSTSLTQLKEAEFRKKNVVQHQMISLKVASAQKQGVDELLSKLSEGINHRMIAIFWDKVKFSRLLQILIKRDQLSVNLVLRLNEASILDKSFIEWLMPGIKRLRSKSKNLVFLIPSNIDDKDKRMTLLLVRKLRKHGCKIALDSFSISASSLVLLKYSKPDYVRLSLPWTRQLQGDDEKEIRLSSAIRQLESRNIRVIAPCGYSKDMRKLFILSGASFCQERSIKTA